MATGMAGAGVASDFANRYRPDAAPIAARSYEAALAPHRRHSYRGAFLCRSIPLVTPALFCDMAMCRMRPAA